MQLRKQRRLIPIVIRRAGKSEDSLIPSVSYRDFQHMCPGFLPAQKLRRIIGLILQTLFVIRPAGRKKRVPDLFPVKPYLVDAQRRGVNPCPLHFLFQEYLFYKYGRGRLFFCKRMCDPFRLKVFSCQQSGLKTAVRFRRLAVIIPHSHAVFVNMFRLQCRSCVFRKHRLFGRAAAGIPYHPPFRYHLNPVCRLHGIRPAGLDFP